MSFNHIAWAFQTPLRQPAKLVLLALANRANDKGECFPSVSTIGDDLGFSRNSRNRIRRALTELHQLGYIEVFAQYAGKGQQTSNSYKLNLGFIHEATEKVGGAYSTRGAYSTPHDDERPVRQGGAQCTRGAYSTGVGAYSTTNQSYNHSSSTTEEDTRARENDSFEGYDFDSELADDDRVDRASLDSDPGASGVASVDRRPTAEDFFAILQGRAS